MPEGNREQQRLSDQELAASLGDDFGLGEVRLTARARAILTVAGFGILLATCAGITAIPAVFAFDAKVINAAVFGGLFLLGCLLLGLGIALAPMTGRLFWYAGGLAQLTGDEPEPRVLRWADVETVNVLFQKGEQETRTKLAGCILRGGTGTAPIEINSSRQTGHYPYWVLRDLVVEATSLLAPRLVPPLIEIYESGEPVILDRYDRIDRTGITRDLPGCGLIAWREIRSIDTQYVGRLSGPIYQISISKHARKARPMEIGLGFPNGMFIPHLIAYAAAQNGIPLWTYPPDLMAPWQALACG